MCLIISHSVSGASKLLRWWSLQATAALLSILLSRSTPVFTAGVPAPGPCPAEAYQCKDSVRPGQASCIPRQLLCDTACNCNGCDDENPTMCGNRTCGVTEFACGNGQCIDSAWHCDGQADCSTGADESTSCGETCPAGQFRCRDGSRCVDSKWKCDGEADCPDGSDEEQCSDASPRPTVSSCAADRFRCEDHSHCLSLRWVCDGEKDCPDGSDEKLPQCSRQSTTAADGGGRPGLRCTTHEFACTSGRCIPLTLRCDSTDDCGDGSDESNCTCAKGQFACSRRHQCIPIKYVCSGQQECADGTDELHCSLPLLQPMAPTTTAPTTTAAATRAAAVTTAAAVAVGTCTGARCQHQCLSNGKCACEPGYRLLTNGVNCTDIDECAGSGGDAAAAAQPPAPCSQLCINLPGSYRCGCLDGYVPSHFDNHSCKAVGDRPYVVFANRIDIRQLRLGVPMEYTVVVNEGRSILALDIDESKHVVYYSDAHEETIYRANLPSATVSDGEIEPLVKDGVGTVDGIAYDWIYKKVYWTDAETKEVSAVETSYPQQRVVLISGLSEPRAIALHPSRGLMFFSDWGRPAIYRAGMDGESLTAIVTDDITWPNGLALDHTTELLYWIDAKLKSIRMSGLDGQNQRVLMSDHRWINNPFAISVFEDNVYWSERGNMTIMTAHKLTGANVKRLLNDTVNSGEPLDLKVHHSARQPPGVNLCESKPCQQLCFPAASWPGVVVASPVSCRCAIGYRLDANKRTCSPSHSTTTVVAASTSAEPQQQPAASAAEESSIGKGGVIAGITMAVLVVLAGLVALLVLFMRRHCVNDRTVNFDNPVYMKTTDDKLDLKCHEQRPSVTTPAVLQPLNTAEAQAASDDCDA